MIGFHPLKSPTSREVTPDGHRPVDTMKCDTHFVINRWKTVTGRQISDKTVIFYSFG
jgi:hypothetical protein